MRTVELRTYTIAPGRAEALYARFRDHTDPLFREHGMRSLGYWTPSEHPDQLVYLIEHDGDVAANWESFRRDPRWIAARNASVVDGELTTEIRSVVLLENALSGLAHDGASKS